MYSKASNIATQTDRIFRRTLGAFAGLMLGSCCATADHREAGYRYLSPSPGAEYVAPQTRFVLVRFEDVPPAAVSNLATTFVTVTGELSGSHAGKTRVASDQQTILFEMEGEFVERELVTVTLEPELAPAYGDAGRYAYAFMVAGPMPGAVPTPLDLSGFAEPEAFLPPAQELTGSRSTAGARERMDLQRMDGGVPGQIMSNGVSVPSDFPEVNITVNDHPSPDYLFVDYHTTKLDYMMILDNDGAPVWYRRGMRAQDFKVQKNGWITYFVGPEFTGDEEYRFIAYDANFDQSVSYRAVNGYETDGHELQVLEDGSVFLFGIRDQPVDMGRYVTGGLVNAKVYETVLQEFTPEGDLIFQWRSWDHYSIGLLRFWAFEDSLLGSRIRFAHMNAVDVDTDGHLLISSKHQGEVTKVNRQTGEVIWRLGGGHPTNPAADPYRAERLQILADPLGGFDVQHDIRVVGTNRYTLFDNHYVERTDNSRAVEYQVDPEAGTATWVWDYAEDPPYGSYHMGNAQRLSNGNTLINWVLTGAPKAVEVRPDGTKAFEMNWAAKDSKSYRVMRFPWHGTVAAPNLLAEARLDNVTLLFNKFGDSSVAYYRIYGGTSPNPTTVVATSRTTLLALANVVNGETNYFRVTAVLQDGTESEPSDEVSLMVNIVKPGENMVLNGTFSEQHDRWSWLVSPSASAQWTIEGGDAVSHLDLTAGGLYLTDVSLVQPGMKMLEGRDYVLEYEAWAEQPRLVEVNVFQGGPLGVNYSRLPARTISPVRTRYRETFTVNYPTYLTAMLVFAVGASDVDVYLDNVSLVLDGRLPGDLNEDGCVNGLDLSLLVRDWMQTGDELLGDLNGDRRVDFLDLDLLGQNWSLGTDCP